jgi:cytochrome c oxidase cbb3-type subunit 3
MFSHYVQSISFVTVYPIVSLILFFVAFISIVVWAVNADDEYINTMETLPLDQTADTEATQQ